MKKKIGISLFSALLLCLIVLLYFIVEGKTYSYYLEPQEQNRVRVYSDYLEAFVEDSSVAKVKEIKANPHNVEIILKAVNQGESRLTVFYQYKEQGNTTFVKVKSTKDIKVDIFGRLIVDGDSYKGIEGFFFLFFCAFLILSLWEVFVFLLRWRRGDFSYRLIYKLGLGIFFLFLTFLFWQPCKLFLQGKGTFYVGMKVLQSVWLSNLHRLLEGLSFALMGFAVFLLLSNLLLGILIGYRRVHILGYISGGLFLGLGYLQKSDFLKLLLSIEGKYGIIVFTFVELFFLYFLSMGLGVGLVHFFLIFYNPEKNIEEIAILGCGTTKEDKVSLEMKNRLNQALALYHKQKDITFLLLGGRKKNRNLSEAKVMQDYLLENGVKENHIRSGSQGKDTKEKLKELSKISHYGRRKAHRKLLLISDESQILWELLWARSIGLYMQAMAVKTKVWKLPNAYIKDAFYLLWKERLLIFFDMFFLLLSICMTAFCL